MKSSNKKILLGMVSRALVRAEKPGFMNLFNKKFFLPPAYCTPPQNAPLASTDFVHSLDMQCQAVVQVIPARRGHHSALQAILESQKAGTPPGSSTVVPGTQERLVLAR